MPQCSRVRRPPRSPAAPWVSLRSRSLGARLRSHAKRLVSAPHPRPSAKRKPRSRKRKSGRGPSALAALSGPEDQHQSFICGHAFEVLFALGLVPSQRRLLQLEAPPLRPSLNRMHVMEGDCDKSSEMVAESAPDLVSSEDIKLTKEETEITSLPEEAGIRKSPCPDPPESEAEPLVNGEVKKDKSVVSEESVVATQSCADSSKVDEERTKSTSDEKEEASTGTKEVKESGGGSGGCSEEEDRNSVTSSQSRKRTANTLAEGEGEGSSSESDAGGGKRTRLEADDGEDERERLVREYVEECTESVNDMSRAAEKLQREIGALGELMRAKELEWNSILRLRKLKEEMLERLLRRRRLTAVLADSSVGSKDDPPQPPPYKIEKQSPMNSMSSPTVSQSHTNGGLMMVPMYGRPPHPPLRGPRVQRPILPKPPMDQNSIVGEGRSRHPEHVPRRGRRLKPPEGPGRHMLDPQPPVVSSTRISGSPALMSMASMALGSGSHVRENPAVSSYMGQESSRPSSADSSRSGPPLELQGLSFKDALVQFAKLSQPSKPPPPPPPYPEVTLHPVSPPPPPHSSLLHGILTKPVPAVTAPSHRATTFSPTLARLLTAPERTPPTPLSQTGTAPSHFRPPASRVNITEILSSSKKTRNEITITPVSGSNKTKEDVVLLGDEDEETDGDRLVIDESRDGGGGGNTELPENVPECQGCHQRPAQFVCAGCGNQWYCSRECQVTAWEDHSEHCSG